MMTVEQLQTALAQAIGGDVLYKHWLGIRYTEGVKFLAESAGAYWLIDAIASHQPKARRDLKLCQFQAWTLSKVKNGTNRAVLICERDTDDVAIRQKIEYTDFPLAEIKLYLVDGVLMLTSEY